MKGYMYILECNNGCYYTGSTNDLERRLAEHQNGEGANFTKKHLPVKLVYFEEFQRIDEAFYREKQVQGWSRKKKEALINGQFDKLTDLSRNYTQYLRDVASTGATPSLSKCSATVAYPFPELVEGNGIPVVESNSPVVEPVETITIQK
ncbi:MAG: GIY-YIG nuclease family protein [Bacteroidales bacterium]|jgi:putative endonuclease|nr:GIY-YIG nuclease family protein [Bacteroidales bacterium]